MEPRNRSLNQVGSKRSNGPTRIENNESMESRGVSTSSNLKRNHNLAQPAVVSACYSPMAQSTLLYSNTRTSLLQFQKMTRAAGSAILLKEAAEVRKRVLDLQELKEEQTKKRRKHKAQPDVETLEKVHSNDTISISQDKPSSVSIPGSEPVPDRKPPVETNDSNIKNVIPSMSDNEDNDEHDSDDENDSDDEGDVQSYIRKESQGIMIKACRMKNMSKMLRRLEYIQNALIKEIRDCENTNYNF